MNLPSIVPPADLLRQVEGIERGLRQQRRLGALGWLGVLVALAQAMTVVVQSGYWSALVSFDWQGLLFGANGQAGLLDQWAFLVALGILLGSFLLISWKRFWLKESQEPFRYTFSVGDFSAISGEDPSLVWLRHHLAERLNRRIGRLSLLEEEATEPEGATGGEEGSNPKRGAPAPRYESHVHVRGHYGIRVEGRRWIVEVMPRVRVGPPGSPETMARRETYTLNPALEDDPDGQEPAPTEPDRLGPDEYQRLLERVYHSVATEIYRQITRDVQHKIDLLPTSYLRATAYLHEARDYARSNTLVAFDEAERLYKAAILLYDPSWRHWPTSPVRWPGHLLRQAAAAVLRSARWLTAFAWRRAAGTTMLMARAEMGYANVLLDRRSLAGMSGYRLNPIFEARPVAEHAVRRLERLPRDVEGAAEGRFDAHVTMALTWAFLGSLRKARKHLDEARRLLPTRATVDARFAYADGTIEARPRSRLLRLQRAVELDPNSEAAQFALAFEAEKLWRTRADLEANVADTIVEEYEQVVILNPGNIAAWGNLGYMQWLLARDDHWKERLAGASRYFERGRDYKAITRETYVAEIDYGLARIAAERGWFSEAYVYFTSALTAHMAQSTSQGYTDSWSSLSDYYFVRIDRPILDRFHRYKERVKELHGDAEHAPDVPPRVRDSVLAFVVNDYGEACYNYFKRSRDERYRERAREQYLESARLDPFYAIPRHNLFLLNKEERSDDQAERDAEELERIEPDWFEAKLAIMWKRARDASRAQLAADELHRQWRGNLRESTRLGATAEDRDASVYAARQPAARHRSTLYRKPQEARSRNVKAGQLVQDAGELWRREQELLREADEHQRQAEHVLRQLVPHQWLWQSRVRRRLTPEKVLRSPARRWRLDREWRWEREFDNVHVKALYDWGVALLSPGTRKSPSDRILAHIEEHFWQDNFEIVHHFRRQVDRRIWDAVVDLRVPLRAIWVTRAQGRDVRRARLRLAELREALALFATRLRPSTLPLRDLELRYQDRIDKYNEILAATVLARVDEDPTGFWALSWLDDGLQTVTRSKAARLSLWYTTLDSSERLNRLVDALRSHWHASPALYQWLGEQLTALREELENRRELGQKLQEAAKAISDGDQRSAARVRDELENCDWRGLEGSALKEYRRALKARYPHELARIAERLEHPHGDGSGDLQAVIDDLKRHEIDAYLKALKPEDQEVHPLVHLRVAEALRLLGKRDQSEQALRAYRRAIRRTTDPAALWHLAEGYKELGDWRLARETFHRAQQAEERRRGPRWRDGDRYHWEIARALWGEGRHHQALDELDLVSGEPEARTRFVDGLLHQDAIPSPEAYHTLRAWLERHQRAGAGPDPTPAGQDAGRALLRLALVRRRPGDGAAAWSAADRFGDAEDMLPVVAPVVLHAEPSLFSDLDSEAPQARRLMDAYAGMLDRLREELGVRIPGCLIRPSEVLPGRELPLERRQYLVMLHEVPLAAGVATRTQWEQQAVSSGIEPTVRRYLDTYLGVTEVRELLAVTRAEAQLAADRSDDAECLARELESETDDRRLRLVQVLQRLVREGVSVTELGRILDQLDRPPAGEDADEVADRLRPALLDPPPRSTVGIRLGPEWEATVRRWVRDGGGRPFLAVPAEDEPNLRRLLGLIAGHAREPRGAVLVVPDDLRRLVARLAAGLPRLRVLADREWPGPASRLRPLEPAAQPETVG